MKINPEIKKARQEMVEEYQELRRKLLQIKQAIHQEENEILEAMFYEMTNTDEPLTAAEISAKLGGAMSKHEVAGQLKLICNPWIRNEFQATHEVIENEKSKNRVRKEGRIRVKRFAEIDNNGEIIPNGEIFETVRKYNTYIKEK